MVRVHYLVYLQLSPLGHTLIATVLPHGNAFMYKKRTALANWSAHIVELSIYYLTALGAAHLDMIYFNLCDCRLAAF